MKIVPSSLARRPWLLVIVAFIILISAWTTIIMISVKNPISKLTPGEEEILLHDRQPATTP